MARVTRTPGPDRASLIAATKVLGDKDGKVGWFESAKYPGGQPVAGVAAAQEFGTKNIPPRSFFRPTAAQQQGAWAKLSGDLARAAVRGQIAPEHMMEALTLKAEGDVRRAIIEVTAPALKESTVKARKRRLAAGTKVNAGKTMGIEKPLVDSGLMLVTLTSKVEK